MSKISAALPVQDLGNGETRQGFFDFQRDAITFLQQKQQVILADQPGLGKTLEILGTLEAATLLERPGAISLVLAPGLVAQTAWKPIIDDFVADAYPNLRVVYAYTGTSAKKQKAVSEALADTSTPLLIVANHNAIDFKPGKPIRVPALLGPMYDAIIIDEAHLVLPTRVDAQAADRTQFWQGLAVLRHHPLQLRIPMSGTPFRGKLENILGYYRFMQPTNPEYSSFWGWTMKHFRTYERIIDRRGRTALAIDQKPRNPLQWIEMQQATVLRRTKLEVLKQLPPKQYENIVLPMTPAMKQQYEGYESALRLAADQRAEAGFEESAGYLDMKMYTRGRQLATCRWEYAYDISSTGARSESGTPLMGKPEDAPKLEWILQFLRSRDADTVKVVISSAFTGILEWLRESIVEYAPEYSAEVLSGSTATGKREQIRESFQKGGLNVVLLSQAMGTGITLDAADDLILTDIPNDPDVVEQVEDRVHRATSFNQVTIWRLMSEGTKDIEVVKKQDKTFARLRGITDSTRGVRESRKMLSPVSARQRRSTGLEKNQ